MTWSHFEHGADIGLRGSGKTREQAFEAIAMALTAAVTDPASVATLETIRVHCDAPRGEMLLADWLNALIYEMDVRKMLFSEFKVSIADGVLDAEVSGEPVDRDKHQPAVEVKGATYTAIKVENTDAGWDVQCVVDV